MSREQFGELGGLETSQLNTVLANCDFVKAEKGQEGRLTYGTVLLKGRLSNGFRAFSYLQAEESCAMLQVTEDLGQYIPQLSLPLFGALNARPSQLVYN